MSKGHCLTTKEIGQLRIYVASGEKRKDQGCLQNLFGKYLYREIIDAARQNGIFSAVAYPTHYGYSGNGNIESDAMSDIPNASLNLCLELTSPRGDMESFVREHREMLKDKVLVYKRLEHWEIDNYDGGTGRPDEDP